MEPERVEFLSGVGEALLRPVRPDDAGAINCFFERLTREDVRMRFFSALRSLPQRHVERLVDTDFERDIALLLIEPVFGEILGVARLADAGEQGEIAITVRSDMKHNGIGAHLLTRLLDHARRRGLQEVFGDILPDNRACLGLARKLGFTFGRRAEAPYLVRARLRLERLN
jgi:acetyltransferase